MSLEAFKDVQFNNIDGISSRLHEAIITNFEDLSDIASCDPSRLISIKGITHTKAVDIKNYAKELLEKKKPSKTRVVSRIEPTDRELIMVETRIDKMSLKRSRRVVTPAVCRECGFDLINHYHLEEWNDLDEITRARLDKEMKKHHEEHHSLVQQKIIRESDLVEDQRKQRILSPTVD